MPASIRKEAHAPLMEEYDPIPASILRPHFPSTNMFGALCAVAATRRHNRRRPV